MSRNGDRRLEHAARLRLDREALVARAGRVDSKEPTRDRSAGGRCPGVRPGEVVLLLTGPGLHCSGRTLGGGGVSAGIIAGQCSAARCSF